MANMMLEEEIRNLMKKLPHKKRQKGASFSKHIKDANKELGSKGIQGLQTHGISLKSKYADVVMDDETNILKGNHASKRSKTQTQ